MKQTVRAKATARRTRSMSMKFTDGTRGIVCSSMPRTEHYWRRYAADQARRHGKHLDWVAWLKDRLTEPV